MIEFEWDKGKSESNVHKHGVSFEEAKSVFFDDDAILFHDPDHSDEEERFLLLGMSLKLRVVLVCHCLRSNRSVIRIISARRATAREQRSYFWRGSQ